MALSEREKKTIQNMITRQQAILEKHEEKLKLQQSHRDASANEIKRLQDLIAS